MEPLTQSSLIKSLLILTDFSQSAKNAASYAINLAQKLKTDLVLFNAYLIPDREFDSWPMHDEGNLSKESVNKLQEETIRLQTLATTHAETFIPKIAFLSLEGTISENVNAIIDERKDILMVIMGGGKCNGREDMLFGMEITEVLVNVKCPTLIIPNSQYPEF
jgi:nucleotide-binding universal stress UspA family protein